jgi:hypothetical protein
MNPIWLGNRISFGLLASLLPLFGFLACSAPDQGVNANQAGSPASNIETAGAAGVSTAPGPAGASSVGGAATSSSAGAFGQGGFASSPAAGSTSGAGGISTAPGGTMGAAAGAGGTAGAAGGSAGEGNAGLGGRMGSAGSSAAFVQVSSILGKNCGIKGCHADKQSPHFVPGAMLYATLTGPNTVLAECGYTKLVQAGDPANSALVRLMNRKCDSFTMPPSCNKTTCLAPADLKTLSDWIQAGAPP